MKTIGTWYMVLFNEIKKVKVVKEIGDFIWVQGKVGERKFSCYCSYYDTFTEAKRLIRNQAEVRLIDAERMLKEAQRELQEAKNIQEKDVN